LDEDLCMFFKCLTVVICTLIVVCGGCSTHKQYRVSQSLEQGVDPLLVACAYGQDNSGSACQIVAAKR
jgi:hypothetical protein